MSQNKAAQQRCLRDASRIIREAYLFPTDRRYTKSMLDSARTLIGIAAFWTERLRRES